MPECQLCADIKASWPDFGGGLVPLGAHRHHRASDARQLRRLVLLLEQAQAGEAGHDRVEEEGPGQPWLTVR